MMTTKQSIRLWDTNLVPAVLILADGSEFPGISIGAEGKASGEVVFNTAMTGYQEVLTDPSYAGQMVTFTAPHIGNVGVNSHDAESSNIGVAGLVVKELSPVVSNWRAEQSLEDYLKINGIVGIRGVDTRRLTRLLREKGALGGCLLAGAQALEDKDKALEIAKLAGEATLNQQLSQQVSVNTQQAWKGGGLYHFSQDQMPTIKEESLTYHIVVYDCGVKHQILRVLEESGCRLTLVPMNTNLADIVHLKPDGVLFSNGPGDPEANSHAIDLIQQLLSKRVPLLGICLGFQLLGLALGAKTVKMKFGHHGANHPIVELKTGRVFITSQNHSFAVDEATLPDTLQATYRSLFDNSLQGIAHTDSPAIAFQGHPEASPGPHDIRSLFDEFLTLMRRAQSDGGLMRGSQ